MFITSFEEQNITYRSCSNLRIHLYSSFLKTLSINKFHDLKLIILHVSIIVIVILFLEDLVVFGGTLANLYAGISSSLVILAIIFTCKLFDNDHHKDDE